MTQLFIGRAELLPPGETIEEHRESQEEELAALEADRDENGEGLFKGCFELEIERPWRFGTIQDEEDGVDRCPRCAWEMEGLVCSHCDFMMSTVGHSSDLDDYEDELLVGMEDDNDEEEDDEDDEDEVEDEDGDEDEDEDMTSDMSGSLSAFQRPDQDFDLALARFGESDLTNQDNDHTYGSNPWSSSSSTEPGTRTSRVVVADNNPLESEPLSSTDTEDSEEAAWTRALQRRRRSRERLGGRPTQLFGRSSERTIPALTPRIRGKGYLLRAVQQLLNGRELAYTRNRWKHCAP